MAGKCPDCRGPPKAGQWICDECFADREEMSNWLNNSFVTEHKKIDTAIDAWRARRGYKSPAASKPTAAGIAESKIEKRKTKALWAKLDAGYAHRILRNLKRIQTETAEAIVAAEGGSGRKEGAHCALGGKNCGVGGPRHGPSSKDTFVTFQHFDHAGKKRYGRLR